MNDAICNNCDHEKQEDCASFRSNKSSIDIPQSFVLLKQSGCSPKKYPVCQTLKGK